MSGDRLSGWVDIFKAPHGIAHAGGQGLIAALRALFATFGVPEEISSDGSPEFSSAATAEFLTRWVVRHHMSSAYFPQSNGRAEVALKKAKRMLMDNVGPTGSLNNDGTDPCHTARSVVPKGGRYASQDDALYRSPIHSFATTCSTGKLGFDPDI